MASHLAWTSGKLEMPKVWCKHKEIFLFQSIDQIMFKYKIQKQNVLINYLTQDKNSGNTIH